MTTLVRNKEKLVKLMRSVSTDAMAFVRRSGIYFGFFIGLVQMVAWALFQNPGSCRLSASRSDSSATTSL